MSEKMEKEELETLLPQYLEGSLPDEEAKLLQEALLESQALNDALNELLSLKKTAETDSIEVPSSMMRADFYQTLNESPNSSSEPSPSLVKRIIDSLKSPIAGYGLATACLLYLSVAQLSPTPDEVQSLPEFEMLRVASLSHQSPAIRMTGLKQLLSQPELSQKELEILEGLINQDDNQHVRLTAAKILLSFVDMPEAERLLYSSVRKQQESQTQLLILSLLKEHNPEAVRELIRELNESGELKPLARAYAGHLI